ncbi:DUF1918 domain-containing protein [Frankia gtarii]|uniref:DUF1918 domain-containing protein n=1 Tax=Frankia gtarii TaxID=2950102 RepID=UPI0021BFAD7B|nr:DUF1918 domain-containing protein [Frankia gtarii]
MSAPVGDGFVIHGRTVGSPPRHGVVIEIGGVDGGPPFVVRWGGRARETVLSEPCPPSSSTSPAAGPNPTVAVAVGGRPAICRPTADDAAAAAARWHHRVTHGGGTGEARGRSPARPFLRPPTGRTRVALKASRL